MAQQQTQEFFIGDRAWFADGRSELVTQAVFNPNTRQWQYELGPLGGFFQQSDLFAVNPIVDVPSPDDGPLSTPSSGSIGDVTEARVREIVAASVAGLLESQRLSQGELEVRFQATLEEQTGGVVGLINNLESRIVTLQSEIDSRRVAEDEAADEAGGGGGVLGFLKRAGGFVTDPFGSIVDRLGQWILDEVFDGLTRRRS